MECTQKLECTQDLNLTQTQRSGPDQIGFLGICGDTYPINIGPNKIGRDPQMCNIFLDMKSLSRQHAVINVLNKKDFMLMDLGSVNKTKLGIKTLQAYIPYPLSNGDTVQFGDVFGVFRLCDDDTDLPMTQNIDMPDTPLLSRHVSRLKNGQVTTVPESPDASDKDDSFIAPSQKPRNGDFKCPNDHFIKPSSKTITKPVIGAKKIDNIFWKSAERSPSLNLHLDESDESFTNLEINGNTKETNDSISIHERDTQLLNENNAVDSIHIAETQMPNLSNPNSPSIHCLQTQLPFADNLPEIQKVDEQEINFELNLHSKDKNAIHDAETQQFVDKKEKNIHDAETQVLNNKGDMHDLETQPYELKPVVGALNDSNAQAKTLIEDAKGKDKKDIDNNDSKESDKLKSKSMSDDEILFDDIDGADFDSLDSQPIIDEHSPLEFMPISVKNNLIDNKPEHKMSPIVGLNKTNNNSVTKNKEPHKNLIAQPMIQKKIEFESNEKQRVSTYQNEEDNNFVSPIIPAKINKRTTSDSSTDCDDIAILPTQIVQADDNKKSFGRDSQNNSPMIGVKRKGRKLSSSSTDSDDINFLPKHVIETKTDRNEKQISNLKIETKDLDNEDDIFEEMATQIVDDIEDISKTNFEDMPTQVIETDTSKDDNNSKNVSSEVCFEEMSTQIIQEEDLSSENINKVDSENNFSEEIISPFKIPLISPIKIKKKDIPKIKTPLNQSFEDVKTSTPANFYEHTQDIVDDLTTTQKSSEEIVPCSVEKEIYGDRFRHIENDLSSSKHLNQDKASTSSDGEEKIKEYVSSLTNSQVKDVIGVKDTVVSKIVKKSSSDLSDLEETPKKNNFKFSELDFPDSQEIKTNVISKTINAETSSGSENEDNCSEDQNTPVLFRSKIKQKKAKVDLTQKFNNETFPSRVITRVRKPPWKLQNSDESNKITKSILKSKFLTEQEDNIDNDIIIENLSRLKNDKNVDIELKVGDSSKMVVGVKSPEIKIVQENKMPAKSVPQKTTRQGKLNNSNKKEEIILRLDNIEALVNEIEKDNSTQQNTSKSRTRNNRNNKSEIDTNKAEEIVQKLNKSAEREKATKSKSPAKDKSKKSKSPAKDKSKKSKSPAKEKSKRSKSPARDKSKRSKSPAKDKSKSSRSPTKEKPKRSTSEKVTKKNVEPQSLRKTKSVTLEQERPPSSRRRKCSPIPETEPRRSKRQKNTQTDSDNETENKPLKSILKKTLTACPNESTVYGQSNESVEVSKRLKRNATNALVEPLAKRTRGRPPSRLRSTPARGVKTQKVLFTAFTNQDVKSKLEKLGAEIVSDVTQCTVLVTLQIKRTFKLLCAVGLGRPVVGPDWVQACADNNLIVDPWLYLIRDEAAEQRFSFSLRQTLVSKRNFLQGYHVSSTPSVMPTGTEMKVIVESSGGTWKEGGSKWICVSCLADRPLWDGLKKRGATVVSSEFILAGVLKQKLEIDVNKLC